MLDLKVGDIRLDMGPNYRYNIFGVTSFPSIKAFAQCFWRFLTEYLAKH